MPRLMHQVKPTLPPSHLLVERRFPLEMSVTLPEIRDLYDSGKAGRWNPHRDIDWTALKPAQYDAPVREAVRRTCLGMIGSPHRTDRFRMPPQTHSGSLLDSRNLRQRR